MWGTVGVKGSVGEKMKAIKAAGFDGVEMMGRMNQTEVLGMSDRIAVMRGGTITGMLPGNADAHDVMAAALGQAREVA